MAQMKTFLCSIGSFRYVAHARSMAEFIRMTGADRAYTSETGNPKDIDLADQAGPDHYMAMERGVWQRRVSKIKLAEETQRQAKAMAEGGGNKPTIAVERGDSVSDGFSSTIERFVVIDGERRGRWRRVGARYWLKDMTGFDIRHTRHWSEKHGGGLHLMEFDVPYEVHVDSWNEWVALANAVECWEAGHLPSVVEQQINARKREEARAKVNDTKAALGRLEPHLEDLQRFLAKQEDPQAARLLAILKGDAS